jgi:hypothetical protein
MRREIIVHVWNEREREREKGKMGDGREIRWMKEIWKRRERIEKDREFLESLFLCL